MAKFTTKKEVDPKDLVNIPQGIDATTFFTPIIPDSVKLTVPLLHELKTNECSQLIEIVINMLIEEVQQNTISGSSAVFKKPDTLKHISDDDYCK